MCMYVCVWCMYGIVKLKRRFSQVCFVAGQPLGISRFLAYFRAITPYISVVVCETGAS